MGQIINNSEVNKVLHKIEDVFNEHQLDLTEQQHIINVLNTQCQFMIQKKKQESLARQTIDTMGLAGAVKAAKEAYKDE